MKTGLLQVSQVTIDLLQILQCELLFPRWTRWGNRINNSRDVIVHHVGHLKDTWRQQAYMMKSHYRKKQQTTISDPFEKGHNLGLIDGNRCFDISPILDILPNFSYIFSCLSFCFDGTDCEVRAVGGENVYVWARSGKQRNKTSRSFFLPYCTVRRRYKLRRKTCWGCRLSSKLADAMHAKKRVPRLWMGGEFGRF